MTAAREEELFLEFKRRPTQDALARLLLGYQDHIYNLCFQVLRHPEDAEDVSQQVLIETAGGIAKIGSPRQFKVWLYKVALHAALKLKETRARRVELARRLATSASTGGGDMDPEERAALMRAIGDLDDRTRCILLEHYFDKLTLEEIGAREGVSSVAIWKRLDRAKEHLRRSLAGVAVAPLLDSISPVAAPAGFAAKAAIAGGVVVGAKSAVSAGTVVAALLLVGAASTGGYLVGSGRAAAKARESAAIAAPGPKSEAPAAAAEPSPEPTGEPAGKAAPSAPVDGKGPAAKREFVPDPTPVNYGRPMKAKIEELIKAETWDEFYKKVDEQKNLLGSENLENIIFQRVTRELGLDANAAQALRKLFEAEREETTRVIIENAGGPAGFSKMKDDLGMNWKVIYDDWRRQRNIVRQTHDLDYQKILAYDQLQFFNEHLRNSEIGFEASYGPEGRHYLVTGVGKPLK